MNLKTKCQCGKDFLDEHGHGLCFGCKIQGISFGKVDPNRMSPQAAEKSEIAKIRAKGLEPVRVTGSEVDKRDARKDYEVPRHLKKYFADDDNKMVDPLKQFVDD